MTSFGAMPEIRPALPQVLSMMSFLFFTSACALIASSLGMTFGIMAAILALAGFLIDRFHVRFGLGIRFALIMLRL
jgi:hypothetical protein